MRFLSPISDRGGAEPYSDTNAPASLERTLLGASPVAPPVGESVEWSVDGKSLDMRASDGVITRIGPASSLSATLTNVTLATETIAARFALPAGYLAAGTVLKVLTAGQVSAAATLIYRVRIGTAGTTADPLAITFTTTAAGLANAHTSTDILLSCLTAGAAGTCTASGQVQLVSAVVGPATVAFAAATVNTTVATFLSVTIQQSVAQTYVSRTGVLLKVV